MKQLRGSLSLRRSGFELDARLELESTGITTLSGRSGAGKTTLLRCIAGLEREASGQLTADGELWLDSAAGICLPVERRAIGFVSQDAHLFSHLGVRDNLVFGLKRVRARARRVSLQAVVEALALQDLIDRPTVEGLSGGERRRVAIGRALLSSPALLLLDEPVSALDAMGRREVLQGLRAAVDMLGVPCLYVSHDLQEAARIADQLLWMQSGRIVACGPIGTVLCDPHLPFAQEPDAVSVVEATVAAYHAEIHLGRLEFPGGELWVALEDPTVGRRVRVQIGARDISLAMVRPERTSVLNVIACQVEAMSAALDSPAHVLVRLSAKEVDLLTRVTWKSAAELDLTPGERVWALVKSVAILNE